MHRLGRRSVRRPDPPAGVRVLPPEREREGEERERQRETEEREEGKRSVGSSREARTHAALAAWKKKRVDGRRVRSLRFLPFLSLLFFLARAAVGRVGAGWRDGRGGGVYCTHLGMKCIHRGIRNESEVEKEGSGTKLCFFYTFVFCF